MKLLIFLNFLVTYFINHQCLSFTLFGKKLHGNITFEELADMPEKMDEGSCLKIQLQDISRMDQEAIPLARSVDRDISKNYKRENQMEYQIELQNQEFVDNGKLYSISSVLNCGSCEADSFAGEKGSKWIKEGDFLTETVFLVNKYLAKCKTKIEPACDGPTIKLVKY